MFGWEKPAADVKATVILPEDIVELRGDQIQLAGIQTGAIRPAH